MLRLLLNSQYWDFYFNTEDINIKMFKTLWIQVSINCCGILPIWNDKNATFFPVDFRTGKIRTTLA